MNLKKRSEHSCSENIWNKQSQDNRPSILTSINSEGADSTCISMAKWRNCRLLGKQLLVSPKQCLGFGLYSSPVATSCLHCYHLRSNWVSGPRCQSSRLTVPHIIWSFQCIFFLLPLSKERQGRRIFNLPSMGFTSIPKSSKYNISSRSL